MAVPKWRLVSRGEGIAFRRLRTVTGLYHDVLIEQGVRIFHEDTVEIGANTYIGHDVLIGGDPRNGIKIGKRCWIGFKCMMFGQGGIEIGDDVGIGEGVVVLSEYLDPMSGSGPLIHRKQVLQKTVIESGAEVCCNSVIWSGVRIGECALIMHGTVISQDVPAYEIWSGVPAKKVGEVSNDSP